MKAIDFGKNNFLKKLIELGTQGLFPLFDDSPCNSSFELLRNPIEQSPLNLDEKKRAKALFKRLAGHRTIERQKIVIFSLPDRDKILLLKAFLKMVEGRILDEKITLH